MKGMSSRRSTILNAIAIALFVVLPATVYWINPFHTASADIRARLFGVVPYHIPSHSMAPTLVRGDYILANTSVYSDQAPKVGDIVVFRYPKDPEVSYVKRVVGTPGDRVRITAGHLYVNDREIEQPYIDPRNNRDPASINLAERVIPQGRFFVMGDNRDHSNDSRYWGDLPAENVIGRVRFIWFSENDGRSWTDVE